MSPNGIMQKTVASQRPAILMGILLVLLLGYLYLEHAPDRPAPSVATTLPAPIPRPKSKASISGLVVKQGKFGIWVAEYDYVASGQVLASIELERDGAPDPSHPDNGRQTFIPGAPGLPGAHHVSVPISYPGQITTRAVTVSLQDANHLAPVLASQRIEQVIHWPTFDTWIRNEQLARNSPEQNLTHAVELIDTGDAEQLAQAKELLESLLEQDPRMDGAYVELARIAMKSNWSPEGLHQAETLLGSALQIRPDSANAKVLLGYVYTHQRRFDKAEALFTQAAASNPRNLWLWSNWGELLVMEGKIEPAMAKYRQAIERPMTHDTYDRARADAYEHLLALLQKRNDLDGMEALYKQRLGEFGPGACYSTDYARFMLQTRGNTEAAIDLARGALNQSCEDSGARQILGLAEYVKWSATKGPESAAALNQAHVYLPMGATPLYLLATSERTIATAKSLLAQGENIDQKDSEKLTALAYALQNHDLPAAKRLLALGAHPDVPVGDADMPAALIPVMGEDAQAIRLLRQGGVDYSKLRYRGITAIDFAKRSGSNALLKALGENGTLL